MSTRLFSPLKLGDTTLPNRLCFLAHRTNFAEAGRLTERLLEYYRQRAAGGCGLVILGELAISEKDRPWDKFLEVYQPGIVDDFKKITGAVHRHDCPIFAQLCYYGFQSSSAITRQATIGPSALADIAFGETCKAMEPEDFTEVGNSFADAARQVQQGGFDGLVIDMGAESLLRQFLSPISNFRQDEFGGNLENRARFPLQVLDTVRKAVGAEFTIGIKLCADELFYGGISLEESQAFTKMCCRTGALDFLITTIGTYYNLQLVQPTMHTPFGFSLDAVSGIKEVSTVPVIAGHHVSDTEMAETIISAGQADAVGVVRNLICDPDMPNKVKAGRLDEIRMCARDNQGCVGRINQSKRLSCTQNPEVGYESPEGTAGIKPTDEKKRVMVIGAGPAGMEAARVARLRGHDVVLYEKGAKTGGQVNLAKMGAGRQLMDVVVANFDRSLKGLDIPIELNVSVTREFIEAEKPDVVVVATGSKPRENPVPGDYGPPQVLTVWEVFQEQHPVGEKVLFVDYNGGHHAAATVEYLADLGKQIDMVTCDLFIGQELATQGDLYSTRQRLLKKGVTFLTDIRITHIDNDCVHGVRIYTNTPVTYEGYDTIVLDMGNRVEDALYKSLKGSVKELYRVGDCVAPRGIGVAVYEGHQIGEKI